MATPLATRISLRWGDEEPSEPTDTLVINIGSYYMDMRINKASKSIEWAFAGTREILSRDPLRCRWHKVIDSTGSVEPDEGKFEKLSNGDDLETGAIPNPEKNNELTPYEEVWRERRPLHGAERGWIIERQSEEGVTFLGKYGGVYYAMSQNSSGSFSARREELLNYKDDVDWVVHFASGDSTLPSIKEMGVKDLPGEESWAQGDIVEVEGEMYHVRALEIL